MRVVSYPPQVESRETMVAHTTSGLILDPRYDRGANELMLAAAAAAATTPRLMDAKEQKRREKEMRRLAKLRIEAEIKETKLQAKLAKKQAKRGEPVALGVLHTLKSDGNQT